MRFAEFVCSKGRLSETQIQTALEVQKFKKKKIGRLLVELGFLELKTLNALLIQFLKPESDLSFKELEGLKKKIAIHVQQRFMENFNAILIKEDKYQMIFVVDTFSDKLIQSLERNTQKQITLYTVNRATFNLLLGESKKTKEQKSEIFIAGDISCDQKIIEKNPYSQLIRHCLAEACDSKASDVHFEPFEDRFLIRFRIHGVLQDWKSFFPEHIEPITNKLKWILNLDLAVASKPQDSRASFKSFGIDVRVNSIPTSNGGGKIVLRIQYQNQNQKLSLSDIGLSKANIQVLRHNIEKKDGLIVISGPTGSGKTTTLYALLEEMDRQGKNISTLENPVEKKLERITQSNISTDKDFHDFQKALMRQDPDVILLGEIRDPQTADLSMKLASTGHLVLSTVHANGAREVVDRLLNLGLDEFTVKNNLRLSVAQRLVKRICPQCRIKGQNGLFHTYKEGCENCNNGITGRIAIIEYLENTHLSQNDLPTTLKKECENLAKKGIIDAEEVKYFS
ncbi:MAG: GspE/PulE family protein [Oligoflexales bacterium]